MKITFGPSKSVCEITSGQTLLDAAAAAGVPIDGNCAGAGICGKCKVRILNGEGSPVTPEEENLLTAAELAAGFRLACRVLPCSDMVVEVAQGSMDLKSFLVELPEFWQEEPAGTDNGRFGIAFDIGTTTVAGILWDLGTNRAVGACAETNPQSACGADVISRITYIDKDDGRLQFLQGQIIACMNQIIEKLCEDPETICKCTVAGNPVMAHIFAGVHPHPLAVAPYTPVLTEPLTDKASRWGLMIQQDAPVYLMPGIAGHVGSDITAGLLATNMMEESGARMLIDIGTNGEIVLTAGGQAYACSTAAGPAFEGAGLSKGMRAAPGAIVKVQIRDGAVSIRTIGGEKPTGICGSGIIDAVGQMVQAGIVDSGGRILEAEQLRVKGVSEEIAGRVRAAGKAQEFVLFADKEGEDITINQKDIRQVQLAKGAMRAGMEILLREAGIAPADLETLYIAGAFGSVIDTGNAQHMGLLPTISQSKIKAVGNAAGVGASMVLLSDQMRAQAEAYTHRITHVELAAREDFQEAFLQAMGFEEVEI